MDKSCYLNQYVRQVKRIISVQAFKTFDTLLDFIEDVAKRKPRIPNLEETKFGFGKNIFFLMLI